MFAVQDHYVITRGQSTPAKCHLLGFGKAGSSRSHVKGGFNWTFIISMKSRGRVSKINGFHQGYVSPFEDVGLQQDICTIASLSTILIGSL